MQRPYMIQTIVLFSFALVCAYKGGGETIEVYEDGPIHEAFVESTAENIELESVATEPPLPMNERIPKQLDLQAEWIAGYWSWNKGVKKYVWVSGVWRRPPPGHQWIAGFWKKIEDAWVWIPGFWSRRPLQEVDYIGAEPPDSVDQNTPPPPTNEYFWVPGYWHYLFDKQDYQWVNGYWDEFDPDWVFVPAHYTWRPGGYVFIPAYWDWKLEDRGTAYSAVLLHSPPLFSASYEPTTIVEPAHIVEKLYISYPDHLSLFQHHWHYHPEFWTLRCSPPPWWRWDTWWCFSWKDHWSLWWWYTHPGYPHPTWMTPEISSILPPPLEGVLAIGARAHPPAIVTARGVVSRKKILTALRRTTGHFHPIFPQKMPIRERMLSLASLEGYAGPALQPAGRRLPIDPTAIRPSVRKPVTEKSTSVKVLALQERPSVPAKPKIPSHARAEIWRMQQSSKKIARHTLPFRPSSWTPKTQESDPSDRSHTETASIGPARHGPTSSSNHDSSSKSTLLRTQNRPRSSAGREDENEALHTRSREKWRRMTPRGEKCISRPPIHSPQRRS